MSPATNDKLSREALQALFLKYAGSNTSTDQSDDQFNEYDFNKPHYFNKEKIAMLNDYFETLSSSLAGEFSNISNSQFNAKIISITELFSENLISTSQDEKMPYNLAIQDNNSGAVLGFLSIPQESAQLWTTQLLGETEPTEAEQLSDLEISLLIEVATSFIKAFSDSHQSLSCQPVSETLSRSVPMQLDNCIEMAKINFELSNEEGENSSQASFILFSSSLDSITGKLNTANNQNAQQDYGEVIIEHLKSQQVNIDTYMATAKLTIEDIMNLQTDDVILLDKKVGEPIDLSIGDKNAFQGQIVQCQDSYGVAITKVLNNNIN